MDFLGIGVLELILILILALIVAGPRRMLAWSYQLGKWVVALRRTWAQTARMLQQEFDEAGVDVRVPQDIPTQADIRREVARVVDKYGAPIHEPIADVQRDLQDTIDAVNTAADKPSWAQLGPAQSAPKPNTPAAPNRLAEMGRVRTAAPPDSRGESDLGTWSNPPADQPGPASPPKSSSFGTWSSNG